MKHIWILLLAALLLLTACNPGTPPVEGNGTTTESQTGETTDSAYSIFSLTTADPTTVSPTFENYIKETYDSVMQTVPDLLSHCRNVTPLALADTFELYRFGYDSLGAVDGSTFLVYDNQVYPLGISIGGHGVTEFAYFHHGDTAMLYFIYSWGSGMHHSHIGVFHFNTKQLKDYSVTEEFGRQDIAFCLSEDGKTLGICQADVNWDDSDLGTVTISKGNVLREDVHELMETDKDSSAPETDEYGCVAPEDLCFDDFKSFKENTSTWDEVIERVGHPVPDPFGHVPTDWPYYWETSEGKVVIVFDEEDIVVSITYHPNDTQTT